VAIGQLIMQGREHLVGITAHGKELLLEILRYPNELRDPAPYFEKVTAAPKQGAVAMAAELIERTPERSWTPSDGFPSPLPQSPWRRASTYARASDHWPAPILVSGRRSALD
jgi:hypothetical protein